MKVNRFSELKNLAESSAQQVNQTQIGVGNKLSQMLSGENAFGRLDGVELSGNKTLEENPKTKIDKRFEELKHVTNVEITMELKKSTVKSLETYLEAHKNENGTYDLSKISEAIARGIGSDFVVSSDKGPYVSEFDNIKRELAEILETDVELSDRQVRDLIEFCGYECRTDESKVDEGANLLIDSLSPEISEYFRKFLINDFVSRQEAYFKAIGLYNIPPEEAVEYLKQTGLTPEEYISKRFLESGEGMELKEALKDLTQEEVVTKLVQEGMSRDDAENLAQRIMGLGSTINVGEIGAQKPVNE